MDGAHEPAELHPRHDVLDALKSFIRAGAVIEEQQNTCADLDPKQEQCDAAKKIPMGEFVDRNCFLAQGCRERGPVKAHIQPLANTGQQVQASRFRLTTRSSPRT